MATIRISTFNCENLFSRSRALSQDNSQVNDRVLNKIAELNRLISLPVYDKKTQSRIARILKSFQFDNPEIWRDNRPFTIVEVRGLLYRITGSGKLVVEAKGREDWVGWIELTRKPFSGEQVLNAGRVIQKVNADIQLLIEVENRSVLTQFNLQILQESLSMAPFPEDMLVEGNDPRGIDIGLFSRFPILSVRSYAHEGELPLNKRLFSRDCPVYQILLPGGRHLWLLANHLKSKHGKDSEASAELRLKQAKRVKEIYEQLRQEHDYVIVAGDLNDHPLSDAMKPLVRQTDLKDVMTHSNYRGKLPGTLYAFTTPEKKIDYILLSPALWELVTESGAEYSGAYAPKVLRDHQIEPIPGLTKANAASDHAAVWVDLALP